MAKVEEVIWPERPSTPEGEMPMEQSTRLRFVTDLPRD